MKLSILKQAAATLKDSLKQPLPDSVLPTAIKLGALFTAVLHPSLPIGNTSVILCLLIGAQIGSSFKERPQPHTNLDKKLDDLTKAVTGLSVERMRK